VNKDNRINGSQPECPIQGRRKTFTLQRFSSVRPILRSLQESSPRSSLCQPIRSQPASSAGECTLQLTLTVMRVIPGLRIPVEVCAKLKWLRKVGLS